MRISYTFRNMESSDAIKNHASEKIAKVQKYMRAPLHAEFTFSMERHLHRVDLNLTGDGHQYAGHGRVRGHVHDHRPGRRQDRPAGS